MTAPTSATPSFNAEQWSRPRPLSEAGSPEDPNCAEPIMAETAQYRSRWRDVRDRDPQRPRDPRYAADLENTPCAGLSAGHDRRARHQLSGCRPPDQARFA